MGEKWILNSRKYISWFPSNHVDGAGRYELNVKMKVNFFWLSYYLFITVCSVPEYLYPNHDQGIKALVEKYKNRKK